MSARVIDGKAIAEEVLRGVRRNALELAARGRPPRLAGVRVGEDAAGRMYAAAQQRQAESAGIAYQAVVMPETASTGEVAEAIDALNNDPAVSAILLYEPLPPQLDAALLQSRIAAARDAEGLHPYNLGLLAMGRPAVVPCTAAAAMRCVRSACGELAGRHAVVVGRSVIVGRPVAMLLLAAHCTVTQCHTRTRDLATVCRQGEVLVVAAGKAGLIGREHVRPGAIVIDVGTHRVSERDAAGRTATRTIGDVRTEEVAETAAAVTPVPGGVGPVTVAMLLLNVVEAAQRGSEVSGGSVVGSRERERG